VKHLSARGHLGVPRWYAERGSHERDAHRDPARLDEQAVRVRAIDDVPVPFGNPRLEPLREPRLLLRIREDLQLARRGLQRAPPDVLDEVDEAGV